MDLAPLFVPGETISEQMDAKDAPFPSESYLQSHKKMTQQRFRNKQIISTSTRNKNPF
jgi:hypothetical protein